MAAPSSPAVDPRALGDPGSQAFQVERYPFYLLNRTVGRYNAMMEQALRPLGVDVPSWRVLMILGEATPRSTSQIAEIAVINLSTMTRIIQRMQKAGLVACAARPGDKRVTEVHLTPAGGERLAAIRPIAGRIFAGAVDGFDPAALNQLKSLLDQLHANLTRLGVDACEGR